MNKSLTILAGAAVLLVGLPAGTLPQARAASGTFADVPADHWAYEAVDTLQKAGIVIGYPDGTYGGKRAMTRYEFAEAIARLMPLLNTDTSNLATKDELAAAQQDLQNKLDANSAAIAALQQLVNGFQPELTALGVDVDAIKARLDALEARVAAVEAEQARVKITGDVNIIGRANMATNDDGFVDQNGGLVFRDTNTNVAFPGEASNRLFQADDVYNDFLLGIKGRLNDQATANILIDFGNYLSTVGNTVAPGYEPGDGIIDDGESTILPGTAEPGNQQVTVWEAYLATPTGFGPLGQGDLKVGRLPVQWTNYTLKSDDADVYTHLYQTDSGNIPVDGANVDLHTGPVSWDAWAGKFSAIPFAQPFGGASFYGFDYGVSIKPKLFIFDLVNSLGLGLEPYTHSEGFDQGAGLRGTFGGDNSKFGVSVEQFALNFALQDPETFNDNDSTTKVYNRVTVYGADYDGTLPILKSAGLGLKASWNEAAFGDGSGFNNVESGWRNAETDDQLSVKLGPAEIQGGYKYIGPNYSAPGYWGAIGSWVNPTDIEGPVASASIKVPHTTGLDLGWADYEAAYGQTKDGIDYPLPLVKGHGVGADHVAQYTAGIGHNFGSRDLGTVKYEEDDYALKNADDEFDFTPGNTEHTQQSFLTFGWNHQINPNATVSLLYQTDFFKDLPGDGSEDGQVAEGQFSLHF